MSTNHFIQKTVRILAKSISEEFAHPVKYTQAKRIFESLGVEVTKFHGEDSPVGELVAKSHLEDFTVTNPSERVLFSESSPKDLIVGESGVGKSLMDANNVFPGPDFEGRAAYIIPMGILHNGTELTWDTQSMSSLIIQGSLDSGAGIFAESVLQHCSTLDEKWVINDIRNSVTSEPGSYEFRSQVKGFLLAANDVATDGKYQLNVITSDFVKLLEMNRTKNGKETQKSGNSDLLRLLFNSASARNSASVNLFLNYSSTHDGYSSHSCRRVVVSKAFHGETGFAFYEMNQIFRFYTPISDTNPLSTKESSSSRVFVPSEGIESQIAPLSLRALGVDSDGTIDLAVNHRIHVNTEPTISDARFAEISNVFINSFTSEDSKVIVVGYSKESTAGISDNDNVEVLLDHSGLEALKDSLLDNEKGTPVLVIIDPFLNRLGDDSIESFKKDLKDFALAENTVVVFMERGNTSKTDYSDAVFNVYENTAVLLRKDQKDEMTSRVNSNVRQESSKQLGLMESTGSPNLIPLEKLQLRGENKNVDLTVDRKFSVHGSSINEKVSTIKEMVKQVLAKNPSTRVISVGYVLEQKFGMTSADSWKTNVVDGSDSGKVQKLIKELENPNGDLPLVVVFDTPYQLNKLFNGGHGPFNSKEASPVEPLRSVLKKFKNFVIPKNMVAIFVEDPEAGADQWLPMVDEPTQIRILHNDNSPRAICIGPKNVAAAIEEVKPEWSFQQSEKTISDFWFELKVGTVSPDLEAVFIIDKDFDKNDTSGEFEKFVAYFAPKVFVGVLQYDPTLEEGIKRSVAKEFYKNGTDESPYYFIDKDHPKSSIAKCHAAYLTHKKESAA